jgi:signal transduction histidine kinase
MADEGLMVICRHDGTIREVIRDLPGLGCVPGNRFTEHLEPGSAGKTERLFAAVAEVGAVVGWEVDVAVGGAFRTLRLSGLEVRGEVLLVGAMPHREVEPLIEALTDLSNEQANALRSSEQAFHRERAASESFCAGLLDEFATINNELTALQRMVAQKHAALQRVNEQMTAFLGMAAHDLRNPLGVIRNYAELLLEDTDNPDHVQGLKAIWQSSSYMQSLVDDLLDSTQLESGRLELNLAPIEVGPFMAELVARMRPFAEAKRQRLAQATLGGHRVVVADAVRLEQVLVNLLTNAFKFSPPDTLVAIGWDEAPGEVAVSVTDQGPGIPPAELGRLFQPFGRTSVPATGGEKSTGLGLWIARRVVEAQGGRIEVTSEIGRGSTFRVWLPTTG